MRASPLNYDAWFDYVRLEESAGDIERTREVRSPRAAFDEARRMWPAPSSSCPTHVPSLPQTRPPSSSSPLLPLPPQVYERAIANVPPAPEKRYWQRCAAVADGSPAACSSAGTQTGP